MSRNHLPLMRTRQWQHVRRVVLDRDGWRCVATRQRGKRAAFSALRRLPVLIGDDRRVIADHGRLEAAKLLEL